MEIESECGRKSQAKRGRYSEEEEKRESQGKEIEMGNEVCQGKLVTSREVSKYAEGGEKRKLGIRNRNRK